MGSRDDNKQTVDFIFEQQVKKYKKTNAGSTAQSAVAGSIMSNLIDPFRNILSKEAGIKPLKIKSRIKTNLELSIQDAKLKFKSCNIIKDEIDIERVFLLDGKSCNILKSDLKSLSELGTKAIDKYISSAFTIYPTRFKLTSEYKKGESPSDYKEDNDDDDDDDEEIVNLNEDEKTSIKNSQMNILHELRVIDEELEE
jgi:hypothetical protein